MCGGRALDGGKDVFSGFGSALWALMKVLELPRGFVDAVPDLLIDEQGEELLDLFDVGGVDRREVVVSARLNTPMSAELRERPSMKEYAAAASTIFTRRVIVCPVVWAPASMTPTPTTHPHSTRSPPQVRPSHSPVTHLSDCRDAAIGTIRLIRCIAYARRAGLALGQDRSNGCGGGVPPSPVGERPLSNPAPEAGPRAQSDLLDEVVPTRPPDTTSPSGHKPLASATAGQQLAGAALAEAIGERCPIILLFGETGVGKTTLIQRVLAATDNRRTVTVYLSATAGEFVGLSAFDAFLKTMCQRVADGQPQARRDALAALTSAVAAFAYTDRTLVLAIDHADHLTDTAILDLIRLPEYLNADPKTVVRIFIGSAALAARLDAAVRRPGAAGRCFAEINLPQPTIEEVATLLAYGDMAQSGGPMLTAGAIDRISTYAKSNLHWAMPVADAARALALDQGEREATQELVGAALLEIRSAGQQDAGLATQLEAAAGLQGLSDIPPIGFSVSGDDAAAGAEHGSSSADQHFRPLSAPGTTKTWSFRWPWMAVTALLFATLIGMFALLRNDIDQTVFDEQARVATEGSLTPDSRLSPPSGQLPDAGEEKDLLQPTVAPDTAAALFDEPAPGGAPEERPAAALPASNDKPEAAPLQSPTSQEAKASASPEAKKMPARRTPIVEPKARKKVKNEKKRSEVKWIQRR